MAETTPTLRELSIEELEVEADQEAKELAARRSQPTTIKPRGPQAQPPHQAGLPNKEGLWVSWRPDRIWVQNGTGTDIVVYVYRFKKIRQIMEWGGSLSAGAPGTVGVGASIKALIDKDQVQKWLMTASDTAWQRVFLGSGSGGAYVTARSMKERNMLLCKDILVKGGWCIKINNHPFADDILSEDPAPANQ